MVGLKHSLNQASKVIVWNGVTFDPVKASPVPAGFKRVVGGDLGAPAGQGYFWYEKINGPEIVTVPNLTGSLPRNINMGFADPASSDQDRDCLVDDMEAALAAMFRPFVIFDSSEHSQQPSEPVTVYRLYRTSATTIRVRWISCFAMTAVMARRRPPSVKHGTSTPGTMTRRTTT